MRLKTFHISLENPEVLFSLPAFRAYNWITRGETALEHGEGGVARENFTTFVPDWSAQKEMYWQELIIVCPQVEIHKKI